RPASCATGRYCDLESAWPLDSPIPGALAGKLAQNRPRRRIGIGAVAAGIPPAARHPAPEGGAATSAASPAHRPARLIPAQKAQKGSGSILKDSSILSSAQDKEGRCGA